MQKSRRKVILTALSTTLSAALLFQPIAAHAAVSPSFSAAVQAAKSLSKETALISPRLDTLSGKKIKVIVQLDGATIAEGKYAAKMGISALNAEATESSISKQQSSFISSAKKKGISLDVTYQFNTVLNGMEIEIPANQIPKLAQLSGVKSIYENRTYYSIPVTESTPDASGSEAKFDINPLKQIGVPAAWEAGLTGKGIKVGVIDTGVDYLHPDLKDAFKGGYDSYFDDEDPYEEIPNAETKNAGTSHGTHVSGTIAGQAKNKSDFVQKGVAYESELHVYKVLGFNAETGRSSGSSAQVIDGIERAVKDGMQVINLSLGSDDAKDAFSPDAIAINNAVLMGVTAVVANGNNAQGSEQYYYSMGSPASSQLAISVGAANSPSNHYTGTVSAAVYQSTGETVTGSVYSNKGLNVMGWYTGAEDFASIVGSETQTVVYGGLGKADDFAKLGEKVKGKVVLVSRGEIAFVDKLANAKAAGAKAIVIFNGLNKTVAGVSVPDLSESISGRDSFIGPTAYLGDSFEFVPAFDMEGKPGRALARFLSNNPGSEIQLTFSGEYPKTVDPGDHMADFSSRGPNFDGSLGIKPDFVAPGVNILSTWPGYGKGFENGQYPEELYSEAYNRISGTSMATPHVAGLAVLLKQEHPDWTPFEIRAALANTADFISDANGTQYDVYSQGAGRVNIANAIKTPAVLQSIENITLYDKEMNDYEVTNYGDNVSFGIMPAGSKAKTSYLQVNNTSGKSVTYKASVKMNSKVTSDPNDPIATPDVREINLALKGLASDSTVTAAPNSKQKFGLSIAPSANAETGVYEGEVVLTAEGLPTLHIPFVVHVGTQLPDTGYSIQNVTLSNRQLSPNGDGINDTIDFSFRLAASNLNYLEVTISDVGDKTVGYIDLIYTGGTNITPRVFSYELDGTYVTIDANGDPVFDENGDPVLGTLKDGQYGINVTGAKITANGASNIVYGYQSFAVANNPAIPQIPTPIPTATPKPSPSTEPTPSTEPSPSTEPTATPTPTPSPSNDPGPIYVPGPVVTPTPAPSATPVSPALASILEQGQKQTIVKSATASETTKSVATVTYADLQAAIGSGTTAQAYVFSVLPEAGKESQLRLTSDQVKLLASAPTGSSLYLTTGAEAVELPLSVLASIPTGNGIELIITSGASHANKFAAGKVLGTPVTFELNAVNGTVATPVAIPTSSFISRSFTLDKGVSANNSGVLFLENNTVAPAPAVFAVNADGTTTVTVKRPGFSTYAVVKRNVAFTDISGSFAQNHIQSLAEKFLINGTSDTAFSPKKSVTRAEFAAMLARGLGLTSTKSAPFTDLKAGAWYTDAVNAVYAAGLINGYNDGSFRPDGIISRQELSVMLAKASTLLEIKATGGKISTYGDAASFGAFAKDSIAFVTAAGLMEGSSANGGSTVFQPAAPTTREAAATVIYKLLQGGKLI